MDVPRHTLGGRYEFVAPAGVGGMATVWRGLIHGDAGFTRSVALKRLHPWLSPESGCAELLAEEARLVSELCHPNIVQVFDFLQDSADERYVMVMEWVEGLDLGRYFQAWNARGTTAPWADVVGIVIEVLHALSATHGRRSADGTESPIFHRDVTPSNILLGTTGVSKLTDFGLARAADRVTTTKPGILKGKLSYMAPEYVAGAGCSPRTDLFSVGVVLWEGLAGRKLRAGGEALALQALSGKAAPRLSELRHDLPAALVEAVATAIENDPEKRFESAESMSRALRRVLREAEIETRSSTIGDNVRELARELARAAPDDHLEESGEWPAPGTRPLA